MYCTYVKSLSQVQKNKIPNKLIRRNLHTHSISLVERILFTKPLCVPISFTCVVLEMSICV